MNLVDEARYLVQCNPDLSTVNPDLCIISLLTNINKTPSSAIYAFPGFMPQFAADRSEA